VSHSFWQLLSWLASVEFDPRVGNFRIMSARVVKNIRRYRERLRFLGGIISIMGFTSSYVDMERHSRFAGQSTYTIGKLAAVAADITLAYSDKPLRISIVIGLLTMLLAFIGGLTVFWLNISGYIISPGWASVMIALFFMGGAILANLGIIGYYLGRVFDEVKRRPLYIIESTTPKVHLSLQSAESEVV